MSRTYNLAEAVDDSDPVPLSEYKQLVGGDGEYKQVVG